MKGLVMHLGISKTATATLQQAVFCRHPEIFYLGKMVKVKIPGGCRSKEIFDLLAPVLWSPVVDTDWAALSGRFRAEVLENADETHAVIGSWEGLGGMKSKPFSGLLERLQLLEPDVRLLICLRNPLTWVTSQYLQKVQGQYLKTNRDAIFNGRPWQSFEDWIAHQDKNHGLEHWLSHVGNIKHAVNILGHVNVGVFLFEDMIADAESYYRGISAFIDVDAETTLDLVEGTHHNPRLTQAQLDHIRSVDDNILKRLRWRKQTLQARRRELKQAQSEAADSPGARVTVSEAWQDRIAWATREGHAWLRDELGLDVERHGYPL